MQDPVLILDDDKELGELLRMLLSEAGHKVALFSSLCSMQGRPKEVQECRLAILDIDLGRGEPSGIDAYRWLDHMGFSGKIYFLTGHGKNHPRVLEAIALGTVEVLSKPIAASRLLAIVAKETA